MDTRIKKRSYIVEPKTVAFLETVFEQSVLYPEIDPFHRVFRFADGVYTLHEECAGGGSDLWLNLIEGESAALLVDTGFGIGDLYALVRHLIGDKTLYVVNTHEHGDHVLGNSRFERVWCHACAVPFITKRYILPGALDIYHDENGNGVWLDFCKEDLPPFCGYELIPCGEGDTFDLGGGHVIEVLYTPGHAAGGISLLDRKNRILFSGAMHSGNTVIAGTNQMYREQNTVEAFVEALDRIMERHFDAFDRVFAGHELPVLDKSYVLEQRQACLDVIRDHFCSEWSENDGKGVPRYCHMYGEAGLRFYQTAFRDPEGGV